MNERAALVNVAPDVLHPPVLANVAALAPPASHAPASLVLPTRLAPLEEGTRCVLSLRPLLRPKTSKAFTAATAVDPNAAVAVAAVGQAAACAAAAFCSADRTADRSGSAVRSDRAASAVSDR